MNISTTFFIDLIAQALGQIHLETGYLKFHALASDLEMALNDYRLSIEQDQKNGITSDAANLMKIERAHLKLYTLRISVRNSVALRSGAPLENYPQLIVELREACQDLPLFG